MHFSFLLDVLTLFAIYQEPPVKHDFREDVKTLRAEYQKAEQEYYRPLREAKSDEDRRKIKLDPEANPTAAYLEKFKKLADDAKGTEGAADALIEVLGFAQRLQRREEGRAAVERLTKEHVQSPAMERLANSLRYAGYQIGDDACKTALEAIRDKSLLPRPKAAAIFILAVQGMERDAEASRTAFIRLMKEFQETQYAAKADKFIFELENLQIGKVAPDFEASDEKGVKFKLSDYRGRVTVIDFWGFW